jgi:hypothetical protein
MGYHCKCCGRKRSELLQRSPWKATFSAMHGSYTVTLQEIKVMIKARTIAGQTNLPKATGQQTTQESGFQEVRRRMRRATNETAGSSKEATVQTKTLSALNTSPPPEGSRQPQLYRPSQGSGHGHRRFRYRCHFK